MLSAERRVIRAIALAGTDRGTREARPGPGRPAPQALAGRGRVHPSA